MIIKRAYLSVTETIDHCYGCGTTVGVHEFVLRDSDARHVIGCLECQKGLV